jgi:hypothetical protein
MPLQSPPPIIYAIHPSSIQKTSKKASNPSSSKFLQVPPGSNYPDCSWVPSCLTPQLPTHAARNTQPDHFHQKRPKSAKIQVHPTTSKTKKLLISAYISSRPTDRTQPADFPPRQFPSTNGIGGEGQGGVALILTLVPPQTPQKNPISRFLQVPK